LKIIILTRRRNEERPQAAMDEGASYLEVHTPTKSELATFQVLANLEFVNFSKPAPTSETLLGLLGDNTQQPLEGGGAEVHVVPDDELAPSPADDEVQVHAEDEQWGGEEKDDGGLQQVTYDDIPRVNVVVQEEEAVEEPQVFAAAAVEGAAFASAISGHEEPPLKAPKRKKMAARQSRSASGSGSIEPPAAPYAESTRAEVDAEKEALLSELHTLERQGQCKLVRPLAMSDSLEEIQFQYDRVQAEINASQMVEFAKSALKMGSGMLEMMLKKAGIKIVDGYHHNLCKDMSKFNRPLGRMYKKYWRRGGVSPESELAMLVFGSLAWTVVQNKLGSASAILGGGGDVPPPPPTSDAPSAPAARPMRPPQMSSLKVPATWSAASPPPPPPLQPDLASKMRDLEAREATFSARLQSMHALQSSLEAQAEALRAREQALEAQQSTSLDDDEGDEEELEPPQQAARRVTIQSAASTVTPKRSSIRKKATAELVID
jgi:hypothetical protein